jgi:hypothetical protein
MMGAIVQRYQAKPLALKKTETWPSKADIRIEARDWFTDQRQALFCSMKVSF